MEREEIKKKKLILFSSLFLPAERVIVVWREAIILNGLEPDDKVISSNRTESFSKVIIPILAQKGKWTEEQKQAVIETANELFKNKDYDSYYDLSKKFIKLQENGHKLGLITESPAAFIKKRIKKMEIPENLFTILKTDDDPIKKPDPRVLDSSLELYPKEDILFVGHCCSKDLKLAKEAGLDFVAITSVHPSGVFQANGVPPEMIYRKVTDFFGVILN